MTEGHAGGYLDCDTCQILDEWCYDGENDCPDCCDNGLDDDNDGWVDDEDADCGPVSLTLEDAVRTDLHASVTASIGSANSLPVGAGHDKYICDFQGCNETDGTCLNKDPFGDGSQEYFCTTTGTACSFDDTTIRRSGGYTYTACVGENSAGDVIAVNAVHCSYFKEHSEADDVW